MSCLLWRCWMRGTKNVSFCPRVAHITAGPSPFHTLVRLVVFRCFYGLLKYLSSRFSDYNLDTYIVLLLLLHRRLTQLSIVYSRRVDMEAGTDAFGSHLQCQQNSLHICSFLCTTIGVKEAPCLQDKCVKFSLSKERLYFSSYILSCHV